MPTAKAKKQREIPGPSQWVPVPRRQCLFKVTPEEKALVVNLNSGVYYTLNRTAQMVWREMDGKSTVERISERISRRFGIARPRALRDISLYARNLRRMGLVQLKGKKARSK